MLLEFAPKDRGLLERIAKALEAQAGFAAGAYQSQKRVEHMLKEQAARLQEMAEEAAEAMGKSGRILPLGGRAPR